MPYLFISLMIIIATGAFTAHEITVGILALGLLMFGVFIYQFQDHPAVQEWLEKHF
jgi:hypothetical protein